ncbi:MAG: 2-oxoacid:acceptor oxidoreductase subunit alpha [Bacteroidetes bacterium]|nr:MAG: 2-oxoacid:acceptor oxidoreductase subunit alpha [Bacteroidota bacterium]
MTPQELSKVTILFSGDSGDGIQLTGSEFSHTAALYGNDLSTFPDFPAEIRAPIGTVAGVSGFRLNFGSIEIHTPGGHVDVLVVMNAAALKKNIEDLRPNGLIIANSSGFDKRNLKLAGYDESATPLDDLRDSHRILELDVTKLTRESLKESSLGTKERDRSKNMFVLGFLYWIYGRSLERTTQFLTEKFAKRPEIAQANIAVLKAGYHYGETTEASLPRYVVKPAPQKPGVYRNISGNQATALGLVAASQKSGLDLFYGSYPITPASDILHELAKHKNFGVKTFQAEDEIAAITAAIGASFGGAMGVTASSGPGIALKGEAIGLAVMLELPLVIVNVQRGGPSTGLPTKTEQADLFQAMYGRNGEAPLPVFAAKSPSDAFDAAFEAAKYAIEYMTPVMLLSDGYIANGSEPWMFPTSGELSAIHPVKANLSEQPYLPYKRNERGVRSWAIPGQKDGEHRIGGLEKEIDTGNVSYDARNHEAMVKIRAERIEKLAESYPPLEMEEGEAEGDVLVIGWGSTYGAVKVAARDLNRDGFAVSHLHLRHLYPLHPELGHVISRFKKVVVPELNNGQLIKILREKYLVDAIPYNKIQGQPLKADEVQEALMNTIRSIVKNEKA